jgi:hypothetical protein
MVHALRDADGAKLDRSQIVKGWVDTEGQMHERLYDVAASDGRTISLGGGSKTPVGTTVTVQGRAYTSPVRYAPKSREI